jgi:hypothetical protein
VDLWRDYNGRAACENVIKELDAGYGLPDLTCKGFRATEAALSFAVLAHNLIVLFERRLGWQEAVTLGSLRYWLFVTAGIIGRPQGQTTIKLAVPSHERDWWQSLWEKLLSPDRCRDSPCVRPRGLWPIGSRSGSTRGRALPVKKCALAY